ncbi:hypothetical protein Tco_0546462 [Tanacetum coccineum]
MNVMFTNNGSITRLILEDPRIGNLCPNSGPNSEKLMEASSGTTAKALKGNGSCLEASNFWRKPSTYPRALMDQNNKALQGDWNASLLAYKLELPEELSSIHNTFHVSNLKKCLSDESLIIPMKELQLDDKLNFVEEPVEVMDREIKQLKRSRIPIVKVRWNSKRGPEFTWEREDEIRAKYPHLFSIITSTSNQISGRDFCKDGGL